MMLYCLKDKTGFLWYDTISTSKDLVWWNDAFTIISALEGDEWSTKNWKKVGPSKISAWRRGWSIVPVEVKEVIEKMSKGKSKPKKEAKKPSMGKKMLKEAC